jgi:hypothetical protein
MMHLLKMELQQTISTLSGRGWSQRRIARELDIYGGTVARYRRMARQPEASKPAIAPAGSRPGRPSHCRSLEAVIKVFLDTGLSAQRIYQDLVADQKFEGNYDLVKCFVRPLDAASPLPFRRMETDPRAGAGGFWPGSLGGKSRQAPASACILRGLNRRRLKCCGMDSLTKQVAAEVGYRFPHHFSRAFKKVHGMSPSQFRKQFPPLTPSPRMGKA